MNLVVLVVLAVGLLSCETKKAAEDIEFFSSEISNFRGTRKILDLDTEFVECGEWGGHEEAIYITAREDGEFHLHYRLYGVDCENMVLIEDSIGCYNAPLKELVDSCTFVMNDYHKKLIIDFSREFVSAKFREEFPGHAGARFALKKYSGFSGDGFTISCYGFDSVLLEDYKALINGVGVNSNVK